MLVSKYRQNFWTKRFQWNPHNSYLENTMLAIPFPFHAVSNWVWPSDMQKIKGPLIHSPTSSILRQSSKLFWGSSLMPLFDFEKVLQSRLDWVWSSLAGQPLLLTFDWPRIANWLWSPPNAIARIEWWFFRLFRCHFRVSYDWNSRLHVPLHLPSPIPFPLLCMGNGHFTSISTGQNGTKTSPFFLLLLYTS